MITYLRIDIRKKLAIRERLGGIRQNTVGEVDYEKTIWSSS